MAVIPVTDADFKNEVLDQDGLVLVDFQADWCGPCRQMAPVLDKLSEDFGNITFRSLDVDANPEHPAQYRVSGIPTLKVFKNGEEVASYVGARPYEAMKAELAKL